MHSGFNPPGARVRFPRDSSTDAGQGRVTAALDAQDHGMVTCAFPKSISSPGMIPSSSPSPPSLRQETTTILRVEGRRDVHVEGYGSRDEEEEEQEGREPEHGLEVRRREGERQRDTEKRERERERETSRGEETAAAARIQPPMRRSGFPALPLYCTAAPTLTSSQDTEDDGEKTSKEVTWRMSVSCSLQFNFIWTQELHCLTT
ncbi:unnamed protein product [Xyrichtys novacula]|uniref:Unnamed protein product n=1 Tax=Xyrichtys novacula TaxID=13765 RepID=A0AAV1GW56_XYRNO|nr:unnamed protein product [Xyrichtys novacula]